MRFLAFLFLIFVCTPSMLGQTLSKDQVQDDLAFLVAQIKTYNPALEVYNPDFDSNTQTVIDAATDSLNILEYFKKISLIASSSNEGHFKLGNWEDAAHKGFLKNTYKYLPLSVRILAGKVYVWSDFSEENELQKGDEILSINNTTVSEILESLSPYIPKDGTINTYFEKQAESGFGWMYYLYIDQPSEFTLQVKRVNTPEVLDLSITALTVAQRNDIYAERYPKNPNESDKKSIDDLYTISYESNHAVLTLKSFDYRLIDTYKVNAGKLYGQIFDELKERNVQSLIIDLRNNTGGRNEFADDMVPYITQHAPDDFLKKSVSWEGKEKTYKFPKTSKSAFNGTIYCLVNGKTYSAGATLARYLKEYGNAISIGEETGSRYEGYAAGSTQSITLPATDIKIGIPRYHTFYPESAKQSTTNRGLIPDHLVQPSIQDMMESKDKALELALGLIR